MKWRLDVRDVTPPLPCCGVARLASPGAVWVMPFRPGRCKGAAHSGLGGFRLGNAGSEYLGRFRLTDTVGNAPGALPTARRDASVMTPIRYVPRPDRVADFHARGVLESALTARDGYRCFYCNTDFATAPVRRHIDHVTARAHGGSDSIENLVWACDRCNLRKGREPGWFFALRVVGGNGRILLEGFEPPFPESDVAERPGTQHDAEGVS